MNPDETPVDLLVRFDEHSDDTERLLATPLGENKFRVEQTSILGDCYYHSIIEVAPQDDGTVLFLRVLASSGMKTTSWILSRSCAEAPHLSALRERVKAIGGASERVMGGLFFVHLPPTGCDALIEEFDVLFGTADTSEQG